MQQNRNLWHELTKWKGVIWIKNCPLCTYPNDKEDDKLVIYKTKYWIVIHNKYPYGWIKKHLLVFPKRHIELTKDLDDSELLDLKNIHEFLYKFYEWKKYFSFLRETFEWRSIKHLHYHYLPWNIHGSDFEKILNKQWY